MISLRYFRICYNILMPNLTPFEIALLVFGAVLIAALGVFVGQMADASSTWVAAM